MKRRRSTTTIIIVLLMITAATYCKADDISQRKMSRMISDIHLRLERKKSMGRLNDEEKTMRTVCSLVKISGNGKEILEANGCRYITQLGDIYIADVPEDQIKSLANCSRVSRIEAGECHSAMLDTTLLVAYAKEAHQGNKLQHPFRGKGVVMGMMDIGFDFTNPNFYNAELTETRIKRVWDQLSADTENSTMYVGNEYTTPNDIIRYAHSHDGLDQSHGTHTLGIATGTGFDTPYRGLAPEADICLVSNATTEDLPLISPDEIGKYTTATDVLGFKYIFDYATQQGKPCVISFSEGSFPSFDNDEELFYEALDRLTGEGRIIVASAGNNGHINTYFHKPANMERGGSFFGISANTGRFGMVADDDFNILITMYEWSGEKTTITINTNDIKQCEDSTLNTSITLNELSDDISITASPTYYDNRLTAYSLKISSEGNIGNGKPLSVEVVGNADVKVYSQGVYFLNNNLAPSLNMGEKRYSLHSPSSAPAVISVGATSYRDYCINADGEWKVMDWGKDGVRAGYSSAGPTHDGRLKPDVVAPGSNVISSMSSFIYEAHPDNNDIQYIGRYSQFNDRSYPWMASIGTSMATPVVAGAIALWLEANPRLTTAEILDILAATCHRNDGMPQGYKDEFLGFGEIDVYAGLLKAMGIDGIEEISHHSPKGATLTYRQGCIEIAAEGIELNSQWATVSIYSTTGELIEKRLITLKQSGNKMSINGLKDGLYVVQLDSADARLRGSVVIKK